MPKVIAEAVAAGRSKDELLIW
ncbi:hypothetical protein [Aeromonas veronii]